MNEKEQLLNTRLECVKLGVATYPNISRNASEVLDDAKKYFDFVKGQAPEPVRDNLMFDTFPDDVVKAARFLTQYFEERGILRWAVGNVRSRD